jgi:hypothetical protein
LLLEAIKEQHRKDKQYVDELKAKNELEAELRTTKQSTLKVKQFKKDEKDTRRRRENNRAGQSNSPQERRCSRHGSEDGERKELKATVQLLQVGGSRGQDQRA